MHKPAFLPTAGPPATDSLAADEEDGDLRRLEVLDALQPGQFWRAREEFTRDGTTVRSGDVHLLVDVFFFEQRAHTAHLLVHPRDGADSEFALLVEDLFALMEPAHDADAVRAREQREVLDRVAEVQEEMARAESAPASLPGLQDAVEEELERAAKQVLAEELSQQREDQDRRRDLGRLHRRAARRAEAAGNPLVPRGATISDRVNVLIGAGINSQQLRDFVGEAKRHEAIATATAHWLERRAEELTRIIGELAPFYAERGRVAQAKAKRSMDHVKAVAAGLRSLKLYTGDGVSVVTIASGAEAPPTEPLTLVQTKRYADQELAAWADVTEEFDWTSQELFFTQLRTNRALLDQVLPTQRCVASVAITARSHEYANMNAYEAAMYRVRNRLVFLMVRNGENIHVVYSGEPSHEAAHRLYPNSDDEARPFQGLDGSRIGVKDLRFEAASKLADAWALHYRRFLILLCGLDHRVKLFGDFYPPAEAASFLTLEFQQRRMRFLNDDEPDAQLGEGLQPVVDWIAARNRAVRSGARIVAHADALAAHSPGVARMYDLHVDHERMPAVLIVQRAQERFFVRIPTFNRSTRERGEATVWLQPPAKKATAAAHWFLCLDLVQRSEVERYVASRRARAIGIDWIRAFKRAAEVLRAEEAAQAPLQAHLRRSALEAGVLAEAEVEQAIRHAIATWRAAHRGVPAPEVSDTKAVNEILTLMYPADRIVDSWDGALGDLINALGAQPLKLTRAGTSKFMLYVECDAKDRSAFPAAVEWGWVKRLVLQPRRSGLSVASSTLCWLREGQADATETAVREWPQLNRWINKGPETANLKELGRFGVELADAAAEWAAVLAGDQPMTPSRTSDIVLRARDALGGSYGGEVHVRIPVAAYQPKSGGSVLYVYATCTAARLLNGHAEDGAAAIRQIYRHASKFDGQLPIWSLRESHQPLTQVGFDQGRPPPRAVIDTHERGGEKRAQRAGSRAERATANGAPKHAPEKVELSMSHAFDSIFGLAPRLRRAFHRQRMEDYRWDVRFASTESDRKAIAHAVLTLPFEPRPPAIYASPLVWDERVSRGIGNRHFPRSESGWTTQRAPKPG